MDLEIEAKFYPVDPDRLREKLKGLGAKLVIPKRLMRRVLFDRIDNPGVQGSYLRVRDEGNLVRLSLKVHAEAGGAVTDQKEAEVEVADFDKTVEIMKLAGLVRPSYQETYREEWDFEGAELVIDWWPGLEPYIEIETISEEKLKLLAQKLGFDWEKKVVASASYLYEQIYGLSLNKVLALIKNLTFENQPFADLEKKVPNFFQPSI